MNRTLLFAIVLGSGLVVVVIGVVLFLATRGAEPEPTPEVETAPVSEPEPPDDPEPVDEPVAEEPEPPLVDETSATPPEVAPLPGDAPPPAPSGGYCVQVGAYQLRRNADLQMDRVRSAGEVPWVREISWQGQPLYRVRIGGDLSLGRARSLARELQDGLGTETWITR